MNTLLSSNSNILRNLVALNFDREILGENNLKNIAIVGGSLSDHEVELVRGKYPEATIKVYGIEEGQLFMDLNLSPVLQEEFDLVLCTNVLEHVFHHENFAKNLLSLLNTKGVLWLVFPFSDMFHGSPFDYSAGFHPDYVERLFLRNDGKTELKKIIASKRLYFFTHLLQDWPSEFRYNNPLVGQIIWGLGMRNNPRPPIRNLNPSHLLIAAYLSWVSPKFSAEPKWGCGVWMKIRKA